MMQTANYSKVNQVKSFFEKPEGYLAGRGYNIEIRAEAVGQFVRNAKFERILDVGCGDGSMSVQLLNATKRLTLVDVSSKMLSIAQARVPEEFSGQVETFNDDF